MVRSQYLHILFYLSLCDIVTVNKESQHVIRRIINNNKELTATYININGFHVNVSLGCTMYK